MTILRVNHLKHVFGSGELAVTALEEIDFAVEAGELMALLGPSGSGKSTLLLCISLILAPTAGSIEIDGQTVYAEGWAHRESRRLRREKIGFIFQGHNLIPFLSARDNIVLALELNGVGRRSARQRADELLDYLEVTHRANALPGNLSGGEQQRVAIGRALANEPPLILADEPTASLDTERGGRVMELLKRIARERNSAVITVTHDERMIAGFDTVRRLRDGRLLVAEEYT
ncbi:ABC transporter ATP-binding protein [Thiohalomonas denitrificans]|uniref:ABC transporter ATP-binding protein n=1 Tax=Thiohalomonas denitrificans TaxID=415747 RepID=UPI0026E9FA78|nr:ABC transporter ATP-binding protein [Thiohalomonas denitrificans]